MSHKFEVCARASAFSCCHWFYVCVCASARARWCVYCIHCERIWLSQFTAQTTNNLNEQRTFFSDTKHHNLDEELKKLNIINLRVKVWWVNEWREWDAMNNGTKTCYFQVMLCLDVDGVFFSGYSSARTNQYLWANDLTHKKHNTTQTQYVVSSMCCLQHYH